MDNRSIGGQLQPHPNPRKDQGNLDLTNLWRSGAREEMISNFFKSYVEKDERARQVMLKLQDVRKAAEAYNRMVETLVGETEVVEINNEEDYEALQPFMESMITKIYENPEFTFEVRGRCIEAATEIIRYSDGKCRYKLRFKDYTDRKIQLHRLAVFIQNSFDFFNYMEDEHGT